MLGVWFLEKAQDRTGTEKGELGVKGEKKKRKKKNCLIKRCTDSVRALALALENANAISKGNITFISLKPSTSENGKGKYCKFFTNTCYSAILSLELHCSRIV